MYEQFTEQFQTSLKPVTALMEINIKAVEALAEQQASFFTSAMNDSLAYTQDISSQTDLASLLKIRFGHCRQIEFRHWRWHHFH